MIRSDNFAADAENVSLEPFVTDALKFLQHAESVGGRVFVHCISGE